MVSIKLITDDNHPSKDQNEINKRDIHKASSTSNM